jgi:hypothetical protein
MVGVLHYEDAPFNRQLLYDDNCATLGVLRDLGKIDRHLRGRDTNGHSVEYTASDEHATAIAGNLNRCAEKPPQASEHQRVASSKAIR